MEEKPNGNGNGQGMPKALCAVNLVLFAEGRGIGINPIEGEAIDHAATIFDLQAIAAQLSSWCHAQVILGQIRSEQSQSAPRIIPGRGI
jgi:nitroreductase